MEQVPADATAYVSGVCGPQNPGGCGGWGYSIRSATSEILHEDHGNVAPSSKVTNNVMEYVAVGKAVEAYRATGRAGPLVIRSSSQLVVMQMRGTWPAKKGAYVDAMRAVVSLLSQCRFEVRWDWVPLANNAWAVELSNKALYEVVTATSRRPEHL